MNKKMKILIFLIIIILIIILSFYKKYDKEKSFDKTNIIEISVIDKYDKIKEIHQNPKDEEYVLVDVIIDGNYYNNCGIRTKGSSVYNIIHRSKKDNYSYKIKLDYRNPNQNYKGINEIHVNSSMRDATGIREYLVYDIYNKMGIETQEYSLGHLKLGNVDRGLVTIVEVINEKYVNNKYQYNDVNLYKPMPINIHDFKGADLRYYGEEISLYGGIIEQTKSSATNDEDKKRLINILKKINEFSESTVIEECFMDFDKIIKMVAIDKTLASLDTFTRNNLRNFYLCEKNGKIDIITFDFDFSLNYDMRQLFYTQDINKFDLRNDDRKVYSRITEIIIANEEYMKKYYKYIEETLQILDNMNCNNIVEELYEKTGKLMLSNECAVFTEEMYKSEIKALKDFIQNRKNDYENSMRKE